MRLFSFFVSLILLVSCGDNSGFVNTDVDLYYSYENILNYEEIKESNDVVWMGFHNRQSLGFAKKPIWVKIKINESNDFRYIDLGYHYIGRVDFYSEKAFYTSGRYIPHAHWPVDDRNIVFPYSGEKTILLKLSPPGVYKFQISFKNDYGHNFIKNIIKKDFFLIYIIFSLSIFLFLLTMLISLKDKNIIYYFIYNIFQLILAADTQGYGFAYLWGSYQEKTFISSAILNILSLLSIAMFIYNYTIKKSTSRFLSAYKKILVVNTVMLILVLLININIALSLSQVITFISGFCLMYMMYYTIRNYGPPAMSADSA